MSSASASSTRPAAKRVMEAGVRRTWSGADPPRGDGHMERRESPRGSAAEPDPGASRGHARTSSSKPFPERKRAEKPKLLRPLSNTRLHHPSDPDHLPLAVLGKHLEERLRRPG